MARLPSARLPSTCSPQLLTAAQPRAILFAPAEKSYSTGDRPLQQTRVEIIGGHENPPNGCCDGVHGQWYQVPHFQLWVQTLQLSPRLEHPCGDTRTNRRLRDWPLKNTRLPPTLLEYNSRETQVVQKRAVCLAAVGPSIVKSLANILRAWTFLASSDSMNERQLLDCLIYIF